MNDEEFHYCDYIDDISAIESYVKLTFKIDKAVVLADDNSIQRKNNSMMWGAYEVVKACTVDLGKDPLDVLDKLINDYQVNSLFSSQKINKDHYDNATLAVEKIKKFLLKRRGL